jgi:hypothetical protein
VREQVVNSPESELNTDHYNQTGPSIPHNMFLELFLKPSTGTEIIYTLFVFFVSMLQSYYYFSMMDGGSGGIIWFNELAYQYNVIAYNFNFENIIC